MVNDVIISIIHAYVYFVRYCYIGFEILDIKNNLEGNKRTMFVVVLIARSSMTFCFSRERQKFHFCRLPFGV